MQTDKQRLYGYVGGVADNATAIEAKAILDIQDDVDDLYLKIRAKKLTFRNIVQEIKWRKERRDQGRL